MKAASDQSSAWTLKQSQLPLDASPAQCTHAWLRHGIVSGYLSPGQRITEESLARSAGVSRTSLREAIGVLIAEGFLRSQPYFGTFVAEMTAKDADDLFELHAALEPMAARGAARNAAPEQIAGLHELVRRGRAAVLAGDQGDWSRLHCEFHTQLAVASGNASLMQVVTQLGFKLQWAYATHSQRPPGDSWDEHAKIVDAISDRSADRAAQAATEHMHRGLDSRR